MSIFEEYGAFKYSLMKSSADLSLKCVFIRRIFLQQIFLVILKKKQKKNLKAQCGDSIE